MYFSAFQTSRLLTTLVNIQHISSFCVVKLKPWKLRYSLTFGEKKKCLLWFSICSGFFTAVYSSCKLLLYNIQAREESATVSLISKLSWMSLNINKSNQCFRVEWLWRPSPRPPVNKHRVEVTLGLIARHQKNGRHGWKDGKGWGETQKRMVRNLPSARYFLLHSLWDHQEFCSISLGIHLTWRCRNGPIFLALVFNEINANQQQTYVSSLYTVSFLLFFLFWDLPKPVVSLSGFVDFG